MRFSRPVRFTDGGRPCAGKAAKAHRPFPLPCIFVAVFRETLGLSLPSPVVLLLAPPGAANQDDLTPLPVLACPLCALLLAPSCDFWRLRSRKSPLFPAFLRKNSFLGLKVIDFCLKMVYNLYTDCFSKGLDPWS